MSIKRRVIKLEESHPQKRCMKGLPMNEWTDQDIEDYLSALYPEHTGYWTDEQLEAIINEPQTPR